VTAAILLDTHIIIWARSDPAKLTAGEQREFQTAGVRYVSIASMWEMAVLFGLGRLKGDTGMLDLPPACQLLPVRHVHCKALATLPRFHRDPFDRMLICQAKVENLPLLTRDAAMAAYSGHATILSP
jgi:PIN domain nuclease of toxin-antitoxin system